MAQLLKIIQSQWLPPIIYFFIGPEKYVQPITSLRKIPNSSPGRDMIFQKFGQVVSN
jgi:hypothetical protein